LGYVNLDHVVALNRLLEPGVTSLVTWRHSAPSGRLGGCAANIAAGLVEAGVQAELISWVGIDPAGARVLDELAGHGIVTGGVTRAESRRTGSTWLSYAPGGESYCVYDPGGPPPELLSLRQSDRMAATRWLVVAVGPPGPCAEALDLLHVDAFLLWAVKADPASFPPKLAVRLAGRADVIVYNEDERVFLADMLSGDWHTHARPEALVVQTLGSNGVRYARGGSSQQLEAAERLDVVDTIGAGDRFCSGLLAGLIGGLNDRAAVRAGIESAGRLLRSRFEQELANR
jgi:sugar/nucleoside kinase (ribokinase family)